MISSFYLRLSQKQEAASFYFIKPVFDIKTYISNFVVGTRCKRAPAKLSFSFNSCIPNSRILNSLPAAGRLHS
jgi:hypothetical protein